MEVPGVVAHHVRPRPCRLLGGRFRRRILSLCVSLSATAAGQRDRLGRLRSRADHGGGTDVRALHADAAIDGGRERLIVHLYSDFNTTAFHAIPNDDVPLREEVVPIHDIRVTFGPSYRLGTVHLEPEGQELKVDTHPGGTSVVVPRLDIHSMVVAELARTEPRDRLSSPAGGPNQGGPPPIMPRMRLRMSRCICLPRSRAAWIASWISGGGPIGI